MVRSGDKVMIPDKELCFRLCTVKDITSNQVICFDESYTSFTLSLEDVYPVNTNHMEAVNDNTELMHLHDASLLHNIKLRYDRDQIYTYTAYILIAVNPYKSLPIYGEDVIEQYAAGSFSSLPPHVYALANRAFSSMKVTRKNQSMVVSGESGAGKTVTCKHIMQFLTSVGGDGGIGHLDELEQKIMDANPILEAFGNAKTVRNNNSSRFGKFTEMHFSLKQEQPAVTGALIETYLLEKSRLVSQSDTERNFHIFYQLLAAAPAEFKSKMKSAKDYKYLAATSSCFVVEGVDDAKEFSETQAGFSRLGFSKQDESGIWSILCGLLEFGNIGFDGKENSSNISSASKSSLTSAASLLGLKETEVQQCLTHRNIKAGTSEGIVVSLPCDQAVAARDALAKFIYGKLFEWLVSKINTAFPVSNQDAFIGILDISGFEIFETNSFEQFCINFANEKIQQYFNFQILSQEQQIYEMEGLRYRKVEYEDNQPLLDLVDQRDGGIFKLLDEACLMPRGDDVTFTMKVYTTHSSCEYLAKPRHSRHSKKRLLDQEAFVIKHFAGNVCYETENFLGKNNDTIHDELIGMLSKSTSTFVCDLFPSTKTEIVAYGPTGGRFKSVSATFQTQLNNLMTTLNKTNSHFIRCIKPNEEQSPTTFESNSVMTQLRYSGMCAALLLMQAGFPTRIAFTELFDRYAPRMPAMLRKLKPITFCEALLVALDLDGGKDFQMGLSKVFFRPGKLALMDQLTLNTPENVDVIVSKVRKWLARKRWFAAAHAVVSVNRLGKLLEGIRSFRRFRQAANVMVRIVRTFRPLLAKVRKRLYSEEVLKKRAAEEETLRLAAQEERKKREAEAEALRQAELERIQKEAEEKQRRLEEEKRKQEEARQAMEAKVSELTALTAQLESKLQATVDSETQVKTELKQMSDQNTSEHTLRLAAEEKVTATELATEALQQRLEAERKTMDEELIKMSKTAAGDQAALMTDLTTALSDKKDTEQKLGDALEEVRVQTAAVAASDTKSTSLQTELDDVKAKSSEALATVSSELNETRSTLEGKVAGLEASLATEQGSLAERDEQYATAIAQNNEHESNLRRLNSLVEDLQAQLEAERETSASLREQLRAEQHAHEDDNHNNKVTLDDLTKKSKMEVGVKSAVMTSLKLDKATLSEKLKRQGEKFAKESQKMKSKHTTLQDELDVCICDRNMLTDQKNQLLKELSVETTAKEKLQHERSNLIEYAIRCQEFQIKLRNIYSKFKKDTDLVDLIYGGESYDIIVPHAGKAGAMQKQGGSKVTKWEIRHLLLVDCFLLYYANKKDKSPKGVVRVYRVSAETVDLTGIGKEFGIKVTDSDSAREYFFSAADEAEQTAWIAALTKAKTTA